MKKLLKQSGFTLVEIMIGVGVMCAASIGFMKLVQSQGLALKTGEMDTEIMNITTHVTKVLGTKGGCDATLASTLTKVIPSADLSAAGVTLNSIRITADNEFLTVGKELAPGLKLTNMAVKLLNSNFDPNTGYGSGLVEMTFTKTAGLGGKNLIRRVDFYAKFSSLKYYSVLTSDISAAKDAIKILCQGDVGTSDLVVNIIKSGTGYSVGECIPKNPTELFVEKCS